MIRHLQENELDTVAQWSAESPDSSLTHTQLKGYLNRGTLLAIEASETETSVLAGFIAYRQIVDEAELDQIYVHHPFRQQGLAASALYQWHQKLKSTSVLTVFLDVRQGNRPALALYLDQGYQQVGIRKQYYQIGAHREDALLMQKTL